MKLSDFASFWPADRRSRTAVVVLAAFHLAALVLMFATETWTVPWLMFLLTWGILNFGLIALTRRPVVAAAMSLTFVTVLVILSQLKFGIMRLTVDFLDLIIVDVATTKFLLTIYPNLLWVVAFIIAAIAAVIAVLWRIDVLRMARHTAATASVACVAALTTLSIAAPGDWWEVFAGENYVSKFSRSGVAAISALATHGLFDSAAIASTHLPTETPAECKLDGKPPNIILIHDESSFDIRAAKDVKIPEGYGPHFLSFDGRQRRLMVESYGGASWYSEFNVLTGLSSQSFGRFAYFLPRVAADRIERGLPRALHRCGYSTYSFYPVSSAFMNAKGFHTTVGFEKFYDNKDMGGGYVEPDTFYYGNALKTLKAEPRKGPFFAYVYLSANHFPFRNSWHPDLVPGWKDTGNRPEVDEYLRRQAATARDFPAFKADLARTFPGESFVIVRYGDHQPAFNPPNIMDPDISEDEFSKRVQSHYPRYYQTYYAIDTINYTPPSTSDALDTLDAAYLPLVIQQLVGVPLDASFIEQKKIMARCEGVFFACAGGVETRRFNRMLIDAGIIKRL